MTPDHFCPHLPLECQRIRLRDFRREDLNAFANYRANPNIARYQGWDEFSEEDAEAFFDHQLALRFGVAGSWYQVGIAERGDDRLVGDCVIHFTNDHSRVEIGFTLAPEVHGNGFAVEAVGNLVRLIFTTLDKQHIYAVTHVDNAAAHRLLQRLGFDSRDHNSDDADSELLHTLTRQQWQERKKDT